MPKSTSVYCIGAGLAMNGKKVLLLDVDPQGDLTKMLGQRKPHDMPLTLANIMNDIVTGTEAEVINIGEKQRVKSSDLSR